MGSKKEMLRKKIYTLLLHLTHHTPAEIKEMLKSRGKEIKLKKEVLLSIRIIIPFMIVFLAFFSTASFLSFSVLVIVLFILIALFFILSIRLENFNFLQTLIDSIIPTIAIMVVLLICYFIGSPDYFKVSKKIENGLFIISVFFIISIVVAGIIAYSGKTYTSLIIGCSVLIFTLFFLVPFVVSSLNPYSVCMQLPYLSKYCNPREVKLNLPETIKVPLTGGVGVEFTPSKTLYAGEPFEYTFTLTNYYWGPINFTIKKSYITSYYGSDIMFVYPFNQRINSLGEKEFYQDGAIIDPSQLRAEAVEVCPYYELELQYNQEIECAKDKPCESDQESCIKIGYKKCECVDWTKATCSGSKLRLGMVIEHTGFLIGNASEYYSSINVPPMPDYSFVQGPFSVDIGFRPNPYIGPVHYYREDVSMYVTFRNLGGKIRIDHVNVTPLLTIINTTDKEKKKMLIETIGMEKKWCRDVTGMVIDSNTEVTKLLCSFTPPHVKTELFSLDTGEMIELNNVSLDRIYYYCNKIKSVKEDNTTYNETGGKGYIFWSNYWEKIYDAVEESGLCEILKKERNATETTSIENSLKFVSVYIGINYTRESIYESSSIIPWTGTEECMKLKAREETI